MDYTMPPILRSITEADGPVCDMFGIAGIVLSCQRHGQDRAGTIFAAVY